MRLKCECKKCGFVYEVNGEPPLAKYCPRCGASNPKILERN